MASPVRARRRWRWTCFRDEGATADDVLSDFRLSEAPINVSYLAKIMGVGLFPTRRPLCPEWSHEVSVRDRNQAKIFFAADLPEDEARFAVAHSLGHLLLDHPIREVRFDLRTNMYGAGESEANDFALDLLCPRSLVERGELEAVRIANEFVIPVRWARARVAGIVRDRERKT